nr:WD repeat-containing protein 36 [Onthophagus taurus]
MSQGSKIFQPCRGLGYVSNQIPLQVRYIKSRKENLVVTCVGKSFHTYTISHFALLTVSGLHPNDIICMAADAYHVYTACDNIIYAWRRGTELKHTYKVDKKKPVAFMLPFGAHLISVDENSHVIVWDIKDETVFSELIFNNETFRISSICHPATYINKILFGSEQGSMQLWNINTSKLIYTFKGWDCGISCLEQSPAIDVIAIGLFNGKIILHNLKFDKTVMEFSQDWGLVTSISFRSDNHPIMATGSVCGHIVFWNLEERKVASQLLNAHDGAVTGMNCLPNEPLMVTSSPDNTLKLWIFDLTDGGARLLRIREGHSATPSFIRYHGANGNNILSCAGDSTLRVFNTQTEMFNKSLGTASYNRKISKKRGRGVEDPLKMPPIIEFTTETTREKEWDNIAAIHLGIPMVTTWSYDKSKMGDLKLLPERLHKKKIKDFTTNVVATSLKLTHCGNFVLIGYSSGHVDRFNIQSGLWRDSYGKPQAHEGPVRGISVDNLNQIVTSGGGSDSLIKFWTFKCQNKQALRTLKLSSPISFFRTHDESSMLAVVTEDFNIVIIDLDTKVIIRKFFGHKAQITDAAFNPNSRWLVTASMDCVIKTWDIPSSQLIDHFKIDSPCISLTISPTGDGLATAHVDYLGIFLWSNKSLYSRVNFKALSEDDEPNLVELPQVQRDDLNEVKDEIIEEDTDEFKSPEQINKELITLSGLPTSRWQNLLNLDVIKKRNKPKEPVKAPKAAPFFLPTIPSLTFQFDLTNMEQEKSKMLIPDNLLELSEFGKLLETTIKTNDFSEIISKLKSLGPSMIDFEIRSLNTESGGSATVMLQFFKCIEHMLRSNQDFELAQAYLNVFLKNHGNFIATEDVLRNYLPNIQSCLSIGWHRIQEKLFYCSTIIESLKTM